MYQKKKKKKKTGKVVDFFPVLLCEARPWQFWDFRQFDEMKTQTVFRATKQLADGQRCILALKDKED